MIGTRVDAGEGVFTPAYMGLLNSGRLQQRVSDALHHLEDCDLCAIGRRSCLPNRRTGRGA